MQRQRTGRKVMLTMAALALVVTSCGRSDDNSGSSSNSNNGTSADSGSSTDGAFAVDTADCPDNGTDGISGDTITLASSFPQSGLTAAFAQISKGYKAYFAQVNDAGGVEVAGKKYKIEVVDKDDEYNAAKTSANINELVGNDGSKAFAVFNVVGTANNIAIRQDLGENCVPNLFAATGSPAWGNPDYPWLVGSTLAPYTVEAVAFADYLKENDPSAKVAMLVQNDDYGKAYEEGFKQAIDGTDITVTKVAKYTAGANDVAAPVTELAATGADVFFNGSTLLACPNALQKATEANWTRAHTFVSGTCISKTLMGLAGKDADGVIAYTNTIDPANPAYADSEALATYKDTLEKFGDADVDPENGIVAYGYTQAAVLVKVLEESPELTRSAVLDTMRNIDISDQMGMLVDGVTLKMSADDAYLAENVQTIQYKYVSDTEAYFENVGDILDFEGKTKDITPEDLING
ncbi:MAG: ABC transporter substrate-binding protein [Actinobacteria bacterium]|nr:ABC transporter substrate-binding protein [Actinomycetota bacterium]